MRILHTMLRVGDLQRSLDFYTRILGMKLLRQSENTEYKYTLAFVGYGDEKDEAVIELTYNWGVSEYELGNAYGHIALEAEDIYATCEAIRAAGGTITSRTGLRFPATRLPAATGIPSPAIRRRSQPARRQRFTNARRTNKDGRSCRVQAHGCQTLRLAALLNQLTQGFFKVKGQQWLFSTRLILEKF